MSEVRFYADGNKVLRAVGDDEDSVVARWVIRILNEHYAPDADGKSLEFGELTELTTISEVEVGSMSPAELRLECVKLALQEYAGKDVIEDIEGAALLAAFVLDGTVPARDVDGGETPA
jgi:hypothetical protein